MEALKRKGKENLFNQIKFKNYPFKEKDHTQSKKISKNSGGLFLTYIIERINILKRVINNFNELVKENLPL